MALQDGVVTTLPARRFGRLGWMVRPIGLGGAWLRGRRGEKSIDEAAELVLEAVRLGVDFIDTARRYGDSELVIGAAFRQLPADRRPYLATKSQVIPADEPAGEGVLRSCEDSLQRLGVDRIDLFQIHECECYGYDRIMGPGGALEGLRECQKRGYCTAIGVTGRRTDLLAQLVETGEFDSALTYYEYDLATVAATRDLMPAAERHDVAVIGGSPARMGLFAQSSIARLERQPADVQARIPRLEALFGRPYYELANESIRFLLRDPRMQVQVIGSSRIESLESAIAAALAGPLDDETAAAVWRICES